MLYRNIDGFPREAVMHVAHELRRQGKTQGEIASIVGCSQSTVSMWLREIQQQHYRVDQEQVASITRSLLERHVESESL
ncbi:hypothetical protein AFA_06365 [Alcaligenes faecalis]|uniref:Helix-turn-helix domain-containing protein n=1 Tax=Alcaligenes faecalis TaxID=511 RepID=A0AB33CSH6_ALCFA|nr:hypothetical protein AFA_06365 [Alcaligenes faecalis]